MYLRLEVTVSCDPGVTKADILTRLHLALRTAAGETIHLAGHRPDSFVIGIVEEGK